MSFNTVMQQMTEMSQ